jgi:hypothetical protein
MRPTSLPTRWTLLPTMWTRMPTFPAQEATS